MPHQLPVMTPEQRAAALAKGKQVRAERSRVLAEIRKGAVAFADVLDDGDSPLQGARVRQVLLAVPRIGAATVDRILAEAGIDPRRRISGLGSRQRADLAARLS